MNENKFISDPVEGTVGQGNLGKISNEINIHTLARIIYDKGYMINTS